MKKHKKILLEIGPVSAACVERFVFVYVWGVTLFF